MAREPKKGADHEKLALAKIQGAGRDKGDVITLRNKCVNAAN
jgi:hypothetical protein